MELLIKYYGSGKIETDSRKPAFCFIIYKLSDIIDIII